MTPERWNRLQILFDSLIGLPQAERVRELARLKDAGTDPGLLPELERLLAASGEESFFIDRPVIDSQAWGANKNSWGIQPGGLLAGRFEIVRFIGAGGMGEVFEARDRSLAETVALKCLQRALSQEPDMAARFRQEVQLSRRVTHRNVCRIFDLGQHEFDTQPLVFLTMELVSGGGLADTIRRKDEIGLDSILKLLLQTAEGVAAAHQAGVLHRDLKPGNVLIDAREPGASRAVVTDFGLARVLAASDSQILSSLTQTRAQVGTLAYMAPEQLQGEPASVRSDIYALALLMYEAIAGRRPFEEGGPLASLVKRSTQTPASPQQFAAGLPPRWSSVILHCLDPDPSRRPASVREMLAELEGQKRIPKPRRFSSDSRTTRRQWLGRAAVGSAAAAIGGALWWRYFENGSSLPPLAVSQGAKLLLTQVAYPKEDANLLGVTTLLASQLSQSSKIEIIHPNSVPELLQMTLQRVGEPLEPRKARQLALRMQVPLVLFGAVTRVGSEYVLNLVLERLSPSSELPQESRPKAFTAAALRDLMNAAHDAARWVRQSVGEMPESIQNFDRKPEEATTDSWDALKDFTQGEMELEARHHENALIAYDSAIQVDAGFATAWMRKGDVYLRMGRSGEGFRAWEKAISLLSARPLTRKENWRIHAMYASDTWDYARSVDWLKQYSFFYKNDQYPIFFQAFPLMMMGRFAEALEILRHMAQAHYRPISTAIQSAMARTLMGDYAGARVESDGCHRLNDSAMFHYCLAMVDYTAGNHADAMHHVTESLNYGDDDWKSRAQDYLGRLLADMGRDEEALKTFLDSAAVDERRGFRSITGLKLLSAAAVYLRLGARKELKAVCAEALDRDPGPTRAQHLGALLARGQFLSEAKALLKSIDPAIDAPIFRQARRHLQGEIFLAEGKFTEALSEIRAMSDDSPPVRTRHALARAYESVGQRSLALDHHVRSLAAKTATWMVLDKEPAGFWLESLRAAVRLAKNISDPRFDRLSRQLASITSNIKGE